MHESNIGLNWVKQLRNVLIQLQGEHLLRHLQKQTLISKKEQDERARPTACNFIKKWIPSEVQFKDFRQKIFFLKEHLQMVLSMALQQSRSRASAASEMGFFVILFNCFLNKLS